ncbi:MAG: hypothetical protein WBN11_00435 [Eudoraea sp.]|uniref:hypothetical protein n=1 Tax=Eudoraea sp. TaxID=1979955 RepID=UPI003C79112F
MTNKLSYSQSRGNFSLHINTGGEEGTYNAEVFIADRYFDEGRTLNRSQTGITPTLQ